VDKTANESDGVGVPGGGGKEGERNDVVLILPLLFCLFIQEQLTILLHTDVHKMNGKHRKHEKTNF
jgi:hypothetical protein